MKITVRYYGRSTIEVTGALAEAVVNLFDIDEYCSFCDSHPSWGHAIGCPLVLDAIGKGETLVTEEHHMSTYEVTLIYGNATVNSIYRVEAKSKEEALAKAKSGDCPCPEELIFHESLTDEEVVEITTKRA